MKQLAFFIALFMAVIMACQNDPAVSGKESQAKEEQLNKILETKLAYDSIAGSAYEVQRPVNALSSAISPDPVVIVDAVKPIAVAPNPQTGRQVRITTVLTTDYWVVQALHRINKLESNRINQGAWFKFELDGTYTYGQFDRTIGKGAWTWEYRGDKAYLLMDAELLSDDREWSFLMNHNQDIMVWVGSGRYHTTDIQCKLMNYPRPPLNRTEMALDE